MSEKVNHPPHYGGEDNPFEVIKVLEAWLTPEEFVGFCRGNSIKYTARARAKGGAEDVAKAAWYDARLVEFCRLNPDALGKVTGAVARQLQASMERNARMVNRLGVLAERAAKVNPGDLTPYQLLHLMTKGFAEAIDSIKRDEEPTWPEA